MCQHFLDLQIFAFTALNKERKPGTVEDAAVRSARPLWSTTPRTSGDFPHWLINLQAVSSPVSDLYGFSPIVLQLLPPICLCVLSLPSLSRCSLFRDLQDI